MMIWMLVVLTLPAAALALLWQRWRMEKRRLLTLGDQIPGPRTLPLLGNALQFIFAKQEICHLLASLTKQYGDYWRFWIGPELNVCVKNPSDIRAILTSSKAANKGPWYEVMKPFIGSGILSGGDSWRQNRKMALPCYSHRSIDQYSKVFNEEADALATQIAGKDPTKTFNVYVDCVASTTQCVCQTLMGLTKAESQKIHIMNELVQQTRNMYTLMYHKATKWWHRIPLIFKLTGLSAKEAYFNSLTVEFSATVVKMRKAALRARSQEMKSFNDNKGKMSPLGTVDRFMLSGQLTEQEIRFETITVFTTSQEAAAKILAGVLLFLAHLPEWQDKVYNEITEVLGAEDSFLSSKDVKKLRMLDAVFKEVLRYLPIAVVIQRTATADIPLNNGQYTLPAGSAVVIPILDFHRDPRYWDEPDRVKPERFLPENANGRDSNTYIPFSLGQADCLGRIYGTTIVKMMVVKVLRKVVLEADGAIEDLDLHLAISASFEKGYNLRARPRKI